MKVPEPRRARFLKEMLDAFDSGDSCRLMELADHYQSDFWMSQWWLDGNEELSREDEEVIGKMGKELKTLAGRVHSSARASLSPSSKAQIEQMDKILDRGMKKLSPKAAQQLLSVWKLIDFGLLEGLDAKYAHEVVEKLSKIIARIMQLNALPTLSIPNRSVQLAFEEAHRCYLYGFRTACAALCRATVESSLQEALDASGYKGVLGDNASLREMLQLPKAKTLLGDLRFFADEVRLAGNDAVHDASKFEKRYPADRVQELLLKTRKIIEHLYGLPEM
jgi:hypothetical protein